MKKLLLGLGTIAAVATPIAAVVSCGSESSSKKVIDDGTEDEWSGRTNSQLNAITQEEVNKATEEGTLQELFHLASWTNTSGMTSKWDVSTHTLTVFTQYTDVTYKTGWHMVYHPELFNN